MASEWEDLLSGVIFFTFVITFFIIFFVNFKAILGLTFANNIMILRVLIEIVMFSMIGIVVWILVVVF